MSELTDDQLDGLFRKSAEEFETPFDPAAWQAINTRLDANDRIAPAGGASLVKNILRWGLPILLLLLLGVGGWSVYQPPKNRPAPAVALSTGAEPRTVSTVTGKGEKAVVANQTEAGRSINTEVARAPKPTSIADEPEPDRNTNTLDRNTMGNSTDETPSPLPLTAANSTSDKVSFGKTTKYTEAVPTSAVRRKRADRSVSGKLSVTAANTRATTRRNLIRKRKSSGNSFTGRVRTKSFAADWTAGLADKYGIKTRPLSRKQRRLNSAEEMPLNRSASSENHPSGMTSESPFVSLPALTELAIRPAHWPKSLSFTNRPVDVHPDTVASKIISKVDPMRGLSVRFVVAPDLSGVGLKNFARPGTNVGLLLEYRLASRWSIQAGVIKSTKVYKAAVTDYALPDYALKWAVTPEGVDGRCNMIDIPINVRYDVALLPRLNGQAPSRWFVSSGVTSYIMKQEDYTYQYTDATNPHIYPNNRGWSGTSGAYGFSELNLSAGYERVISRRLSWQVEPFMKVPLKRVGYLKLNLLSTGAFFSLRYKL